MISLYGGVCLLSVVAFVPFIQRFFSIMPLRTVDASPRFVDGPQHTFQAPQTDPLYAASRVHVETLSTAPFVHRRPSVLWPISQAERMAWPEQSWNLFTGEERDRLVHNLCHLVPSTHFSGLGSFEMILSGIVNYVNTQLLHPIPFPRSVHSCDRDPSRQRVLSSYDSAHRPHHIFQDITERLPVVDRAEFLATVPQSSEFMEVRREKNEKGRKFIFDLYNTRADECAESFCILHGRRCRCFEKEPSAWHADESESDSEDPHALHMHAAGVICKDASAVGSLSGDAGQHMHLQHVWCAERRARKEDVILVECTPRWESRSVMKEMPSSFHGHSGVLTTGLRGEQVRRDRRELTMYNSDRVVSVFLV